MLLNLNKICYCLGRVSTKEYSENYIGFYYPDGKYTQPVFDIAFATKGKGKGKGRYYFYNPVGDKIKAIKTKLESWIESK